MLRLAAMQKLDRQTAFTGTKDVAEPLRFDPARLEAYLTREVAGLCRAADREAVQGWAVEPDLSAGDAGAALRAAAGSRRASCCRRRTRSTASSASSARSHAQGFPAAEPVIYCADESVAGTAFYVMGFVAGRVFWNPEMPGSNPGRARGGL